MGKIRELNPSFLDQLTSKHPNFTKSETHLLILIKIGYTQKEIANILSITPKTVKKARSRVIRKLNLSDATLLNDYLFNL